MLRLPTKYLNIITLACILLLTAIIYYKSVSFEFINWDDDRNVYENPDIRSLSTQNIQKIFSSAYLKMYQPITTLSYAVEFKIKGANPHIYHIHNLLLHLLNCLLVFIFVFLLFRHTIFAALVAFLFALHPMHVESVVWITERKDVLYSFFYLLSLIAYIRYLRKGKSIRWLLLSLLFFLISLCSKSAAITLPVVLFLIDFKEKRPINLKTLPDKIPYLLLSILFGIISILSQQVLDPTNEITRQFHFYERFILGSYAFFFYLFNSIVPVGLSALHPFPVKTATFLPIPYFICFLGFLIFTASLLWALIKKKFKDEKVMNVLFGLLFFFVTIGLVIFIPVGSALTAERYTYIPYLGLFIALASLLTSKTQPDLKSEIVNLSSARALAKADKIRISNPTLPPTPYGATQASISNTSKIVNLKSKIVNYNHPRYPLSPKWGKPHLWLPLSPKIVNLKSKILNFFIYPLIGLWLIFLTFSTFTRIDVWKNSLSFWNDIIKKHPQNVPLGYNNRGVTKYTQKDYLGAIADFTNAIHQHPQLKDAYNFRALSRFAINNFADAIRDFDSTLMIDPKFADGYINRGRAKANFGDNEGAINDFSAAISVKPNDYLPYFNRGILFSIAGKKQDAYNDFSSAIQLDPNFADAYYARGTLALELGNKQQACADFNQAARLGNEAAKAQLISNCQ
jgi:protein O-mannosyl-transferase